MIWQHSEKDQKDFITHMKKANHSIQCTHEKSQTDIAFLDVMVHKRNTSNNDEDKVVSIHTTQLAQERCDYRPMTKPDKGQDTYQAVDNHKTEGCQQRRPKVPGTKPLKASY